MYGGILDRSDDDLKAMMRTNVEGTVWASRAAVAQFRRVPQAGGDIVIVSSVAGLRGGADEAVYAATKFAQVGLSGALDREVRPEGVRVNLPRRGAHRIRHRRRSHRRRTRTRRPSAARRRGARNHHRAAATATRAHQ